MTPPGGSDARQRLEQLAREWNLDEKGTQALLNMPLPDGYLNYSAKAIERIHQANLVNFAILPLMFNDPKDYERIDDDGLGVHDLKEPPGRRPAALQVLESPGQGQQGLKTRNHRHHQQGQVDTTPCDMGKQIQQTQHRLARPAGVPGRTQQQRYQGIEPFAPVATKGMI